ncbi:MAG: Transketolase [Paenibacillus sp.]|jgi:transketolase|nr:Transketolase [Paenibacillus sp.]
MLNIDNAKSLERQANQLRLDVVKMVHDAKDGHPGPALSVVDIITALYFKELKIDPQNPSWEDRDRFILSKGHACPALYAALARKGFFPTEEFKGLRSLGSILQGHPCMRKTPGIDMTSGSLGNGLSIGAGMALAGKYNKKDYFTYVILGDGEIQEGIVWEAAMCAKRYRLNNLIVFVDHNGWQSGDSVDKVSGLLPILPKWEAFGWHCQTIDGHDFVQIVNAITIAKETEGPSVIIAKTIKGKGLEYMENDNSWHKRVPDDQQLSIALKVLGGDVVNE